MYSNLLSSTLLFPVILPAVLAFDHVALLARQAPGTPKFACHEACGAIITASKTEGYCDARTFTTNLDACLKCANQFDIWRYYGDSVSRAAEKCGASAEPLPSGAAAATTSAATASWTAAALSSATAAAASTVTASEAAASSASAVESAIESAVASASESAAAATSAAPTATTDAQATAVVSSTSSVPAQFTGGAANAFPGAQAGVLGVAGAVAMANLGIY